MSIDPAGELAVQLSTSGLTCDADDKVVRLSPNTSSSYLLCVARGIHISMTSRSHKIDPKETLRAYQSSEIRDSGRGTDIDLMVPTAPAAPPATPADGAFEDAE